MIVITDPEGAGDVHDATRSWTAWLPLDIGHPFNSAPSARDFASMDAWLVHAECTAVRLVRAISISGEP